MQFLISTDDNNSCTPKYQFLIKHKPQRQVSFNEILNVKVDFLGREMIASPFIANTIRRLSKENECSTLDVNVLIYAKNSNVDDVLMYVFNKNKGFSFSELSDHDYKLILGLIENHFKKLKAIQCVLN